MKPADRPKAAGPGEEGEAAPAHRIRITLTSTATKNLEKGAVPAQEGAEGPGVALLQALSVPYT